MSLVFLLAVKFLVEFKRWNALDGDRVCYYLLVLYKSLANLLVCGLDFDFL